MTRFDCLRRSRPIGFSIWILLLASAAILPSCASKTDANTARRGGEIVPVLAATVTREDVPVTLKTIGTVEAYRTVSVRARVGGALTRVLFREGQDVREGDPLFSIDPRPFEAALKGAEADLAREKARALMAESDAKRLADLVSKDYVSQQESDQAESAADAEKAAVQSLEAAVDNAKLDLEFCSIRSPVTGRTSNLLVQEGNLVRANDTQALVVINQVEPIFVSFSIPERRLDEVLKYMRGSGPGGLTVEATPSSPTAEPSKGRLTFVNNSVDQATGMILLKAEFPNEDRRLWPGEFVQVSLLLTTRLGVVVTPAPAIQSGQKGDYVLVVKADQTTEVRPITAGLRLDGKAIIEHGLEPGETVITDGHLRIVPGAKVAIKASLEGGGAREQGQAATGVPSR
jgi:multidrug efflux system membrane fusion protein